MKKTTGTKTKSSLDVPNYWINIYYAAINRPVPYFFIHNAEAKITLNVIFHRLRTKFKLNPYDLKPLILFGYLHNPLGYADIKRYGRTGTLMGMVKPYRSWQRANMDLVKEVGVTKALMQTVPDINEVDHYLMSQLKSMEDESIAWI